jgi:hypothetical protein
MFNFIVELFRLIGKPELSQSGSFKWSGKPDKPLLDLISLVRNAPVIYGEMNYFREKLDVISFEFTPISSGENAFFTDYAALVEKTPSLGCGEPIKSFYLISDDWTPLDKTANSQHEKIEKICKLIKDLSKVSLSAHAQQSCYNLVFSTPSGNTKPPKTLMIETRLNQSVLNFDISKTSLISSLASEENKGRIHLEERRAILNGAICEKLESIPESQPDKFIALLKAWNEVLDSYWRNFQIYIHSFSFEKVRKEFAQAELDYGTKLSSAFSDIAGKMLALPLSLVAIITLSKASDMIEIAVTSLGLMMASVILFGILLNQLLNIQRLNSSLATSFENLSKSITTYPKNLQNLINYSKQSIQNQKSVVSMTMIIFSILSIVPGGGAVLIIFSRYAQSWHEWLLQNFHSY